MVKSWQEVVDMTDELPEEVQRWTAKRRSALILNIIKGETSVHEAARKYGLTVAEVRDRARRSPCQRFANAGVVRT
jgi:hypothetical protein